MSDERICKVAIILGTSYEYLTDQTDDPAPAMTEERAAANLAFIKESSAKLLQDIEDAQSLDNLLPYAKMSDIKKDIIRLLGETEDEQTLRMIKAALEAAKKGEE